MSPIRPSESTFENLGDGHRGNEHQEDVSAFGDVENDIKAASPSKFSKLRSLKNRAKVKARDVLHHDVDATSDDGDVKESIRQDPAFNPDILLERQEKEEADSPNMLLGVVKSVGSTVAHPKKAIKSKVTRTTAGKLSDVNRPFLSRDADIEFLQAHEELEKTDSARTSRHVSSDNDSIDSGYGHRKDRIERMKAHRESLKIAWTTSRHVFRVRVTPKRQWPYPGRSAYMEKDEKGKQTKFDWLSWIGQSVVWYTQDFSAQYIEPSNSLPFDADTLRHHAERIAVASAPWQSWLMNVRSVYRWEEPHVTGKWFALFLFLWYTNHVVNFLYAYIIYAVLRNRYYPTSVKSLEAAQRRAQDNNGKASKIGELIDKHGNEDWLEPLAKELGPYVQLQLNDIANLLEVLHHFYGWAAPRTTGATLVFFFACLLISFFADMAFCMKIFWFVSGGTFFLCWPVASLYPRYRMLVSPIKWVFWGVPTNAEWSFMYLRREAQGKREELIKRKVEREFTNKDGSVKLETYAGRFTPVPIITGEDQDHHPLPLEEDDLSSDGESYHTVDSATSVCDGETLLTFRCTFKRYPGRFGISSSSISFTSWLKQGESWTRSFLSLVEMRKHDGSNFKRVPVSRSTDVLELTFTDGTSVLLKSMKERDECFNAIIGFSGMQFQHLQLES